MEICYDGRNYSGYQVQKNAPTVAATLQDSIAKALGERVDIKGCSRTDAKVHANRYCVSFDTTNAIPCDKLVIAMNIHLPSDIAAISCREVGEDFHPRYSAVGKRYIYKILNSPIRNPFLEGLVYHYPKVLDVALLADQAAQFVGTYDFIGLSNTGTKIEDTVRTITACSVRREGELVIVTVEGDGFLYNMVRIIVGTLLDINRGKIPKDTIREIILSKDRNRAGVTAPPQGLYLDEVFYTEL